MESILTPEDKVKIQTALAEAFVDNEVDYVYIADRIKSYDLKIVEDILYSEVAPVCFANLETPVPPIWTGFKDEWLLDEIEKELRTRQQNKVRRVFGNLKILWLRYSYRYIWKEILKNINNNQLKN
ncbi:hypothetical protein [Pseudomonas sp. HS6]|uniref:DUF7079 family protein n=1 Tax=Pseudomonas sp. HS6 TaxID=2850559 RepID=UPI002019D48F|nr:hypothetical protein [Pseudomonas sp. HS6]UQS17211.1 hypothetical protein JJN09_10255 [Pseudomonas sp. HS6]